MVADIARINGGMKTIMPTTGSPPCSATSLRVSVKAKLDDAYENKTINLTSVELTNIKTKGNYVNNNWTGQELRKTSKSITMRQDCY